MNKVESSQGEMTTPVLKYDITDLADTHPTPVDEQGRRLVFVDTRSVIYQRLKREDPVEARRRRDKEEHRTLVTAEWAYRVSDQLMDEWHEKCRQREKQQRREYKASLGPLGKAALALEKAARKKTEHPKVLIRERQPWDKKNT